MQESDIQSDLLSFIDRFPKEFIPHTTKDERYEDKISLEIKRLNLKNYRLKKDPVKN